MTGSRERVRASRPYLAGIALVLMASFLIVWTTIVRDDGHSIGFFMVIMAAGVAGFSASFRPAGMARAMAGVSAMQGLLGVAIATAPMVANMPGESFKAVLYSGFFAALWLTAAICFGAAARSDPRMASAR